MQTKKPWHRLRLPLNVVKLRFFILLAALLAVIGLIRNLQSSEFKDFLTQLFSTGKSWNWCPPSTTKLVVLTDGRVLETPADVQGFCAVEMETFEVDPAKKPEFQPLLKAVNDQGQEAVLEADRGQGMFRAQGLPFRSDKLIRAFLN